MTRGQREVGRLAPWPVERINRGPRGAPDPAGWCTLGSFAAAFGTLQLLHIRNAIHADVGLIFAGLVIVHLAQRRHRIARMLAQLMRLFANGHLTSSAVLVVYLAVHVARRWKRIWRSTIR